MGRFLRGIPGEERITVGKSPDWGEEERERREGGRGRENHLRQESGLGGGREREEGGRGRENHHRQASGLGGGREREEGGEERITVGKSPDWGEEERREGGEERITISKSA